jgi:hypothetical protein
MPIFRFLDCLISQLLCCLHSIPSHKTRAAPAPPNRSLRASFFLATSMGAAHFWRYCAIRMFCAGDPALVFWRRALSTLRARYGGPAVEAGLLIPTYTLRLHLFAPLPRS